MASTDRNSFQEFFDGWLAEQNQLLRELISASASQNADQPDPDSILRPLIDRVVLHYEHYYRAKSQCAERDVLSMFSPSWRSSLEEAFLWVGGWRPTTAVHLLYSKSGLQLESQLEDLIRGLSKSGDLADLSPEQLSRVDELHRRIIEKEKEISEKLAKLQEAAADSSMVELSHMMTDVPQNRDIHGSEDRAVIEERVESMLASKEDRLEEILKRADEMRLNTIRDILEILSPMQGVHFLIAAAELHLRFHDWGKKRDSEALPGRTDPGDRTDHAESSRGPLQ